jgi:hypothetical protein
LGSRLGLVLAAATCAVAIGAVSVLDHRHTREEIAKASVAGWYCEKRGLRCDDPQPGAIHDRWETRELGYKAAGGAFAVLFGAGVLRLLWIRSRR